MPRMRCPHCASLSVNPPMCLTCGGNIETPTEQERLPGLTNTAHGDAAADVSVVPIPGLEPTASSSADIEVIVERMPGLITNEEALGDLRIPGGDEKGSRLCPRCRVDAGEEKLCPKCGYLVPERCSRDGGAMTTVGNSLVLCRQCGVPNPSGTAKCLACGGRL